MNMNQNIRLSYRDKNTVDNNDEDEDNGAEALIITANNKGGDSRQYILSTGSNNVYEDGRYSAKTDRMRNSAMVKGSNSTKEDSKSMLLPSNDKNSQKTTLRNAKSMMLSYDAPDTS